MLIAQFTPEQELTLLIPDHLSKKDEGDVPPYRQDQEGVDKPAYGATIHVVNAH